MNTTPIIVQDVRLEPTGFEITQAALKSKVPFQSPTPSNSPVRTKQRVLPPALRHLRRITGFCLALAAIPAFGNPARVDLRHDQTDIRNQSSRNACTYFSVTAAVEAAYKRAGYGKVDLSEEFFNYTEKMFEMAPYDPTRAPEGAVNHLGITDGGDAVRNLRFLAVNRLRLPVQTAMTNVPARYNHIPVWIPWLAADRPFDPPNDWSKPYFVGSQFNTDTANLNPSLLPLGDLTQSRFYGIEGYQTVNPTDTTALENVLASTNEVVVDVTLVGNTPMDAIWTGYPTDVSGGAHSLLLVGYDRTDPANPYFIVKNSWGPSTIPDAKGFQYVTYDFIRRHAYSAGYITSITKPPSQWPELQFLGRWRLDFDGWKGVLDISHLPGIDRLDHPEEKCLGTFYDSLGHAFRVNGTIGGNDISFWIDSDHPNPAYNESGGRHFLYHLFHHGDKNAMAGFHYDPDGRSYAGYARRDQPYLSGVAVPGPIQVSSYFGAWNVNFDGIVGQMRILRRDDTGVPAGWSGLSGTITYAFDGANYTKPVLLIVNTAAPSVVQLSILRGDEAEYLFNGKMESWNAGVMAGQGRDPSGTPIGFYASRLGDALSIEHVPGGIRVFWPPSGSGLALQYATSLEPGTAWLPVTLPLDSNNLENSLTLPQSFVSSGNLFFRLGPPMKMPGLPDLVVTKFGSTGPATIVLGGQVEVPVSVTVKNQGTAAAGLFKTSVEYKGPGDTTPSTVALTVPGQSDVWYPWTSAFLSPGAQITFDGKLTFPANRRNAAVVAQAIADSGAGDEFLPSWIRVNESDEGNNQSDNLTLNLP